MSKRSAAAHGLVDRARAILRDSPEAAGKCADVWRYTAIQPLRVAVLRGQHAMAELLTAAGAGVDHVAGDGRTALDEARSHGDDAMVRALVDRG